MVLEVPRFLSPHPRFVALAPLTFSLACSGNANDVRFEASGSGGSAGGSAGVTSSGGTSSGGSAMGGSTSGGAGSSGASGGGSGGATGGSAGGTGAASSGGTVGGNGSSSGGGGAGGSSAGAAGAGAAGSGGVTSGECSGAAGCILHCPLNADCFCECPSEETCGGSVCEAGQECFGTPDCGQCYPAGTDPAIPSCTTQPCGDQGLECAAINGAGGQVCVIQHVTIGNTSETNYACKVVDPCTSVGFATCDSACVSGICESYDLTCESIEGTIVHCSGEGRCASPDTPIETPAGARPISELQVGDLVYSSSERGFVVVPIARVSRTAVKDHRVMRVRLESGAVLDISAGHPTADGRSFADLVAGGDLDGQRIVSSALVAYSHPFTYDILPASGTGTYVAAGALIGSTLRPRP